MDIKARLEKEARADGAAYFGVADLSLAMQGETTPYERGLISRYPFSVSIGVPLLNGVVDAIQIHDDSNALKNYWFHVYQEVNPLVNTIALRIGHLIEERGYKALQVPASHTVATANFRGILSHKIAAHLAGLGWIGKSCLLVTPDYGTRLRWGTLLTDAPLKPDRQFRGKGCGGCKLCVDNCPAGALKDRPFSPFEPRELRMDASKCFQYVNHDRKSTVGIEACGMCVTVCPFGHKKRRNNEQERI